MNREHQPFRRRTVLKTVAGTAVASGTVVGVSTAQTTINVPDDEDSIEDAIAAADPGGTIVVDSGTFEEEALTIGKEGLTLRGAGSGETTIESQSDGRGLTVEGDDVTLEKFTLKDAGGFGFKFQFAEGLHLEDIHAVDNGRTGLDFNKADDSTLVNVEARNNDGVGIALRDLVGANVENAHTEENAWGGLALWAVGTDDDRVEDEDEELRDVMISGSSFSDHPVGIYTEHNGIFENITLSENTFTENEIGVLNQQGGVLEVRDSTFEIPDQVSGQWLQIQFTDGATGEITGNTLTGHHRVGILLDGEDTNATVKDNKVIGTGPRTSGWAENGIQVSRGATGMLRGNTVEGHWWDDDDWGSSGIIVFGTSEMTIQQNTITNNDAGVALFGGFGVEPGDNNNVIHNTIEVKKDPEVYHEGVFVMGDNNGVRQNTIEAEDGDVGIWVDEDANNTKLIRNDISGWETPITDDGEDTKLPRPFNPDD